MMKKILAMLMILVLCTTAFAATQDQNGVQSTTRPIFGGAIIGGQTNSIEFTLIDRNFAPALKTPGILNIYYSTDANARTNLIVQDTNIFDNTTVTCVWGTSVVGDRNLGTAKVCTYSWTVPSFETIKEGRYYLDYNYSMVTQLAGAGSYKFFFAASDYFNVQQPMSNNMASMIALSLFIMAAGLAVAFVLMIMRGENLDRMLVMGVAVMIALIVGWTIYSTFVVPVVV